MRLDDFLRRVYVPSRITMAASTVYALTCLCRQFASYAPPDFRTRDFNEGLVRDYLCHVAASGAQGPTVNSHRRRLLALWQAAWEEEKAAAPPRRSKIRKVRELPIPPEAWSPEQVARLLAEASKLAGDYFGVPRAGWWTSHILVCYDTGARRSAVRAVEPRDVNLDGAWILFRKTKTIPRLCRLAADTVEACRGIWSASRRLMWPRPGAVTLEYRLFHRLCRAAGIPAGHDRGGLWHKLRRTCGTLTEAAGGDGARAIGDTESVYRKHYRDIRLLPSQVDRLPRPRF